MWTNKQVWSWFKIETPYVQEQNKFKLKFEGEDRLKKTKTSLSTTTQILTDERWLL